MRIKDNFITEKEYTYPNGVVITFDEIVKDITMGYDGKAIIEMNVIELEAFLDYLVLENEPRFLVEAVRYMIEIRELS